MIKEAKLMKHINWMLWLILSFPTLTYANEFNDGNTVGGFFTRMATVLRGVLGESLSVIALVGLGSVASGLLFIAWANKRQISPRFGMILCIAGFAFMSPKACSNMATRQVLQSETQVVTDILDQDSSFISPNE